MIDINFISPTGGIVKSVNGKTGRVELTAADVGAATQEYVAQKIAEAELAGGDVDLSAYYTKSETDKAIAKAQPDLSPYAKKTDIPSTKGLASEKYVDNAIANIDFPETDLTDYATKEYVGQKIAEAQLAESDVDLSDYYTKSETDGKIKAAVEAIPQPDLSEYAKKSEIPSTSGLATEKYVQEQIAKIEIPEDADLSNYYTKTEADEKFLLIEQAPDMDAFREEIMTEVDGKGYLTKVPDEYITETELAGAGYQTEAQVLALITANLPASGEEVSY